MHQKYRNDNILNGEQAAQFLKVSKRTLYRIADRFLVKHPYRRGWFLKHKLESYLAGELAPIGRK